MTWLLPLLQALREKLPDTAHGPDFFLALAHYISYIYYKISCEHPRVVKNMLLNCLLWKIDSEKGGRSESEFYYPEEDIFNQIVTQLNRTGTSTTLKILSTHFALIRLRKRQLMI